MAKERRTNSASSVLGSLLSVIDTVAKVELKDNPEALAEVSKMTAGAKDSNYITAAENLDDNIETQHQVEAILEQAGIDPVQVNRGRAIAGAEVAVAIEEAKQDDDDNHETREDEM
jgi:hypothetical protein